MTMHASDDAKQLALLSRHRGLKSRVQALAEIVEDSDGDLARSDEAERRVVEEMRRLGQQGLHGWAEDFTGGLARIPKLSFSSSTMLVSEAKAGPNRGWRRS